MVKLNAFRTQWHKNMKRKVVFDVIYVQFDMGRVKRIWYLSLMRAAKVQASLRIRAVLRSLTRTSAARSYKQWVKRNLQEGKWSN